MTGRPAILLAAHGERGGEGRNARLAELTAAVSEAQPQCDVGSVLVHLDGVVERTMDACGSRPVVVLPLLFSDGFFYSQRLKPFVSGTARVLAPPLAFWPGFGPLLADNLAHRLLASSPDPRVILVAHGSSSRPGIASAEAAERVAAQLRQRYGQVTVGYLEETPLAADLLRTVEAPYSLVGLFLGQGRHGADDFDLLVAEAPERPAAAFTAGSLPGLTALVVEEAGRRLAEAVAGAERG